MGAIPDFETAMVIIRDLETQAKEDARATAEIQTIVGKYMDENTSLLAQIAVLREKVYTTIDSFQDILGWQQGESRNALISEIRDAVDVVVTQTAPKEAK
jgi:hypothetical protein